MSSPLSLLRTLLDGRTTQEDEERILELLRSATPPELDALLAGVDSDRLFSEVDDRLLGPDNNTALRHLLAVERREDLTIAGRAAVIYALQSGRTDREAEELIRDLFLTVHGERLTDLKNTVNSRVDQHDLEGLVFMDIDSEDVRRQILDHLRSEVPAAPIGEGSPKREAKVLSDIDDTCFTKIHETRWPKGIVVPGVLALYEALDQGPEDQPVSVGDLTFVTARPGDAFGLIENHSRAALRDAGVANLSVLAGGFINLRSKDAMAAKKVVNISHYAKLFPEYDLVFIGDSGQGDVITGEKIIEEHGDVVRAVLIHDVVDTPEETRAAWREKRIYFFDTYVGAAQIARELGLVSEKGVRDVVRETGELTDKVAFESPEQEQAMRALIERDVAATGVA